jgi:2,3-bisphosphoglycerate-dependent phosphoglycerate mutase
MKLIAIRHGETEWNVQGRHMGQLDSPLTLLGIQQAEAIAKRLRHLPFNTLYCSDLGRAIRTAQIVSSASGVEPLVDIGLRERHLGIFQGLTKAEMAERYPDVYAEYLRVGHAFRIPQGESGEDRLARSVRVLTAIAHRHADQTAVVITHKGFLAGFFEHVLDMEPGNGWRFRLENASFNSFNYSDGKWQLDTWNDTIHLDNLASIRDSTARS